MDLQLDGAQICCNTLADLTMARNSDNALQTRLKCVARSLSSIDASAKQPTNQLLFSTGTNLHRQQNKLKTPYCHHSCVPAKLSLESLTCFPLEFGHSWFGGKKKTSACKRLQHISQRFSSMHMIQLKLRF